MRPIIIELKDYFKELMSKEYNPNREVCDDIVKFCYEHDIELGTENGSQLFTASTGRKIPISNNPEHGTFREFKIVAAPGRIIYEDSINEECFRWDAYIKEYSNKYYYLNGKFVKAGNVREPISLEFFEKGKLAIIALESLLYRNLIERRTVN
ncbi:MAG: hypothetical protein PHF86_08280 [Candidatus Nanoarchaeia archaeon]|nr:hypothetical protein [Candidatus Nanoarchaeia archaeon]